MTSQNPSGIMSEWRR